MLFRGGRLELLAEPPFCMLGAEVLDDGDGVQVASCAVPGAVGAPVRDCSISIGEAIPGSMMIQRSVGVVMYWLYEDRSSLIWGGRSIDIERRCGRVK